MFLGNSYRRTLQFSAEAPMSVRHHARRKVGWEVSWQIEQATFHGAARLTEVSAGGAKLEKMGSDLVPGTRMQLSFAVPGMHTQVQTMATVRWVQPGGTFGVQFDSVIEVVNDFVYRDGGPGFWADHVCDHVEH